MTTPVMNILDLAQQPLVLSAEDLDKFARDITALYERQTKESRDVFLLNDFKSLILRHEMAKGFEKAQFNIENIIMLLLFQANELNSRLPDPNIEHYKQLHLNFPENRLYQVIAEAYREQRESDEMSQKGKAGPPKKDFKSFFHSKEKAEIIIPVLKKMMEGKKGKSAARIIAACHKGGWIERPTPNSVKDAFEMSSAAGLRKPLSNYFSSIHDNKPKCNPFSDKELDSIIDIIEEDIKKYKNSYE